MPAQNDPTVISAWIAAAWKAGGTDLLLTAGVPPLSRVDGDYAPLEDESVLSADDTERLTKSILAPELYAQLHERQQIDFSFTWRDDVRVRGNAFQQRGSTAIALRIIPLVIPTLNELGLPPVVEQFADAPSGLVLLTGPTGAGKSTTLASLIDHVNSTRPCHILTIEDPIEYVHSHKRAVVSQREIGIDAADFHSALRAALREDPDVILVGEMRDLESISATLTLAETGHLVFATLHTNDTAQALDRIVDVFPSDRRDQIQVQLSATLQGVIYQRLIPKIEGGMVGAFEIMVATNAVKNLVREGKTRQLRNVISTHQSEGMITLESSLSDLLAEGLISEEHAVAVSLHPREIKLPRPILPEQPGEGSRRHRLRK
ncbi:MAG: twitching motility protein PilT [Acidimicrobiaceae bacterium]|jgi:twitching motility protein PilT